MAKHNHPWGERDPGDYVGRHRLGWIWRKRTVGTVEFRTR